jgi:hypothetical protein
MRRLARTKLCTSVADLRVAVEERVGRVGLRVPHRTGEQLLLLVELEPHRQRAAAAWLDPLERDLLQRGGARRPLRPIDLGEQADRAKAKLRVLLQRLDLRGRENRHIVGLGHDELDGLRSYQELRESSGGAGIGGDEPVIAATAVPHVNAGGCLDVVDLGRPPITTMWIRRLPSTWISYITASFGSTVPGSWTG